MGSIQKFDSDALAVEIYGLAPEVRDIETLATTGVENANHYVMVEIRCSLCAGVLATMSATMYRVLRSELSDHNDTCDKCLNGDDIREARGEEPVRTDYDNTPDRLDLPSPTHPKAFFS